MQFDLIVLGSGGAGRAAALAGLARGLSVCLVEKSDQLGGGTADSLGTIWMPANSLAAAAGLADDIDTALTYARYVGGGQEIAANLEAYVRAAPVVLDQMLALGMGLRLALGLPDYFYPAGPGSCGDGRRMVEPLPIARAELGPYADAIRPSVHNVPGVCWSDSVGWGGFANRRNWPAGELEARRRAGILACGEALIGQFIAQFHARGGTVRLGERLERLLVQDGRVAGVVLASGPLRARRGVVLATGGYEGNPGLVRQFEGFPDWINPFGPLNQGDGLVSATDIGAAVHRIGVNNSLFVGCAVPGRPDAFFSVGLRGLPFAGAIAVNARGERFCDETQFQDVVMALQAYDRHARRFSNLPATMIFDERFRSRYPVATAIPADGAHPDLLRAASLRDLAHAAGIDADGLEATVAVMNADAREGRDSRFGRGTSSFSRNNSGDPDLPRNPQLAPLDTPPFYALKLRMGGVCSAGLLTDPRARVLDGHHRPIAGLYAVGNAAAPTFLGVGYQGGSSIGAGVVFGFLAAEHAATQ